MCYLASEISAQAAQCSRFAMGQDEGIDNEKGKGGFEEGAKAQAWKVNGRKCVYIIYSKIKYVNTEVFGQVFKHPTFRKASDVKMFHYRAMKMEGMHSTDIYIYAMKTYD